MIAPFIFFVVLQLIVFVVYASNYAAVMQKMARMKKLLLLKGIDKNKIHVQIEIQNKKIKTYKRTSLFFIFLLVIIHLIFVILSKYAGIYDYLYVAVVAITTLLLRKTITWMKGAGTIGAEPKFPGFFRI